MVIIKNRPNCIVSLFFSAAYTSYDVYSIHIILTASPFCVPGIVLPNKAVRQYTSVWLGTYKEATLPCCVPSVKYEKWKC